MDLFSLFIILACSNSSVNCLSCSQDQCGYNIHYLDQSGFTALLYSDIIDLQGIQFRQIVGGITSESGMYDFEPYEVDGILVCFY